MSLSARDEKFLDQLRSMDDVTFRQSNAISRYIGLVFKALGSLGFVLCALNALAGWPVGNEAGRVGLFYLSVFVWVVGVASTMRSRSERLLRHIAHQQHGLGAQPSRSTDAGAEGEDHVEGNE